MNADDLIATYPRLYHMAEDASWKSIEQHGLLSTSALLDLHGIQGAEREAIESQRRPISVPVRGPGMPPAVIRDQKPMTASALNKCLMDNMTPREWFELLNGRVFFWLSEARLARLLKAKAYRDRPQIVLTVDTRSLVAAHRKSIELSPLNSGATIYNPAPRGRETFLPISKYPFGCWRRRRKLEDAIVELAVIGGVPDIKAHLVAVHRIENGERQQLWPESPGGDTYKV